jgi:aryl-alcohol dehydrogenase-like predicted oxidoreductase
MERLRRAEMLAERYSVSVPEIAMRYIFGSPMNIFAVVSTTNADRMSMNLRASANPLSSEDRRFLEA